LHLLSLAVHVFFLLVGYFWLKRSLLAWFFVSLPSLGIEFWFERIARPTFTDQAGSNELKRAGEDLDAKGLTEWMWDVIYWTWACVLFTAVAGNWAWYFWLVAPLYSAWLAWTKFSGARQGFAGGMGGAGGEETPAAQSKRQAKMEKRGGQRVQYR